MDWFSGIIVLILIWWTSIFTVLPFSLKRDEKGLPDDPRMKQKILATTALSIVLWLIVYGLIASDIISFREIAKSMTGHEEIL